MEQYISKAAVVAEIEGRLKVLYKDRDFNYLQIKELKALLSFLDTLVVKDEILDKEGKTKLMKKCVHKAYKRGYDMGVLKTTNEMNHNMKDVDTWHLQEKENIYDAVKDWSLQTFVCVMKDGTIQKFTANLDEDYEGHINVHIHGANDDYDNVDDIVKWIEFT